MPTNQSILLLPRDILIQILLLLPFESIPVCKLVSKEWKDLTDDPKFLNRFTSRAFFYFQNTAYRVTRKEGNREIAGRNPPFAVNDIAIDLKGDKCIHDLLSESCSETACLITKSGRLFLYNSITGAVSNAAEQVNSLSSCLCYGFGYDRFSDDFKLMVYRKGDDSLFWVYRFRDDAWRSFEGFPSAAYHWPDFWSESVFIILQACSFNGVLHWVVTIRDTVGKSHYTSPKQVILTYDLHTRRFGEIQVPRFGEMQVLPRYDEPKVAELGGRLCCWARRFDGSSLSVWTMGEYGVSESWTRFLSIGLCSLIRNYSCRYIEPLMLYKCQDGRKLMLGVCKKYGTLYWYDIDNKKMAQIQKNVWQKRRNQKRKAQEIN